MASLRLASLDDAERFAKILAGLIMTYGCPAILLRGALGSGKTTLIAKIVNALPNGKLVETSSPSFNICNFYSTKPPVLHCDLYRCKGNMPEEGQEFMESGEGVTIVEWAEYLQWQPKEFLDISINVVKDARWLTINGQGLAASEIEYSLRALWSVVAGEENISRDEETN